MVLSTAPQFGDGISGFSSQAIVGTDDERLNWFLGNDVNGFAIVVILENGTLQLAQEIGVSILKSSRSTE
jgi:hypothetical protein